MVSIGNIARKKEERTYYFGPNARQDLYPAVQSSKLCDDLNSLWLLGPTRFLPHECLQTLSKRCLSAQQLCGRFVMGCRKLGLTSPA